MKRSMTPLHSGGGSGQGIGGGPAPGALPPQPSAPRRRTSPRTPQPVPRRPDALT